MSPIPASALVVANGFATTEHGLFDPDSGHFTYAGFVRNTRAALVAVPRNADIRLPHWGQYTSLTTQQENQP